MTGSKTFINVDGNLVPIGDGKSAYELAVYNGFNGTEEEWLESLKGTPGKDGTTISIGENKHWIIDGEDSGILAEGANGKDGRSMISVTVDENNNIFTKFTDSEDLENIGKFTPNIQADFLGTDGFGKLRYSTVAGSLQYFNGDAWVDTAVTSGNKYVINIQPKDIKNIALKYNVHDGYIRLQIEEPDDTIVDNQALCLVDRVVIVRKENEEPDSSADGEHVLTIKRYNFGTYSSFWYIDKSFKPEIGSTWYYKAFPISSNGFENISSVNASVINIEKYEEYEFIINQDEPDTDKMISYGKGCNGYTPARMNFETNSFEYGSWEDAWFIKDLKPVILKYNGTVGEYLDKDDFSKTITGEESHISDESYEGNVMIGIPTVWIKVVEDSEKRVHISVANKQLDEEYNCWSHVNINGETIPYCYMSAYSGVIVTNHTQLRSLSKVGTIANTASFTNLMTYARNNNLSTNQSDTIWNITTYSDWLLIVTLSMLISKSPSFGDKFGYGRIDESLESDNGYITDGELDNKGMFYGSGDKLSPVKIFGMENLWGNLMHYVAGLYYASSTGTFYAKFTENNHDGSSTTRYAQKIPDGMKTSASCKFTGFDYVKRFKFDTYNGMFPTEVGGSSETYYRSVAEYYPSGSHSYGVCAFGTDRGDIYFSKYGSMLDVEMRLPYSTAIGYASTGLSCKPILPEEV